MVYKRKFTEHGFGKYIEWDCIDVFQELIFTLALNPLHMLFTRQNLQMFLVLTQLHKHF